jgi:D-arabinose 5-phosphate isomerase GutQ
LRERIVDFLGTNNPGWFKRAHFRGLLEAFEFDESQTTTDDIMVLGSNPEETSELDDILESLREKKRTAKINEIMISLMEED